MNIVESLWGNVGGQDVFLFDMGNESIRVSVSNFGCTITGLWVNDIQGRKRNIVLGYGSLKEYEADVYYVGGVVGRVAGRISGASFVIDGIKYGLSHADPANPVHLHGGLQGFNKRVFSVVDKVCRDNTAAVTFCYRSAHMEEGYPGNLTFYVDVEINSSNEVIFRYRASADHPTPFNPTHHSYFNLSGSSGTVLKHELSVNADHIIETDASYIPSGRLLHVNNSPFDFRWPQRIGDHLSSASSIGYNEYFVLNQHSGTRLPDASLYDEDSGIRMSVETSFPGVLLYTGGVLGAPFQEYQGVCLETMFFPDACNRPGFPSTILRPGEDFNHYTLLKLPAAASNN